MMKRYTKPQIDPIVYSISDDDEPDSDNIHKKPFEVPMTTTEWIPHEYWTTQAMQNNANHQNTVHDSKNSEIYGNWKDTFSLTPKVSALDLIQNNYLDSNRKDDFLVDKNNVGRGNLPENFQNVMFFGENSMQISSNTFDRCQSNSSYSQAFEHFNQSVVEPAMTSPFTSQDEPIYYDHNYAFQNEQYCSTVDQRVSSTLAAKTLRSYLEMSLTEYGNATNAVYTPSVQPDLDLKKPVKYTPFYTSSMKPVTIDNDLLIPSRKRQNRNAPIRPKKPRKPKPTSPWIQVSPDGEIIPSITQNTNSNLYLSNENSQWCIRCDRRYKLTVYHYKVHHPDREVFVARLSPNMTTKVKNGSNSVKRVPKKYTKYLEAVCPFCEVEKSFSTQYWIQHIRSHTGEYMNRCVECNESVHRNSHCGKATIKPDGDFDLRTNDLKAFMCTYCNFIQTDRKNVQKHLENEHGASDHKSRIDEVCLLPSWNRAEPGAASQGAFGGIPMNIQPIVEIAADVKLDDDVQIDGNRSVKPIDVAIKLEANEELPLLNFVKNFKQTDNVNPFHVRPWIDGDNVTKTNLHLATQFALYKCMHNDCLYSTDEMEKWQKHMEQHVKLMDVLQMHDIFDNQSRIEHKKFLECPYCIVVLQLSQVTLHMEEEHRRCIFQCKHCFYRTMEMDNIVLHYKDFHDGEAQEMLVNDEKRVFKDEDVDVLDEGHHYMQKLKCRNCTDQSFKSFNSLYLHLKAKHSGIFNCFYCDLSISRCNEREMQDHLVKAHEYGEFQCLHCSTDSNDVAEIRKHMSIEHPSKFLIVAARSMAKKVYIGNCLDGTAFIQYKCRDTNILNCLDEKLYTNEMNKRRLSLMCNEIQIQKMNHDSVEPINFTKISKQLVQYTDYVRLEQPQKAQQIQRSQQPRQPSTSAQPVEWNIFNGPMLKKLMKPKQPQKAQQPKQPSSLARPRDLKMLDNSVSCKDRNLIEKTKHQFEEVRKLVAPSYATATGRVGDSVSRMELECFSPVPDPQTTVIRYKYINQKVAEDMGLFRKAISEAATEYGLTNFLNYYRSVDTECFQTQNEIDILSRCMSERDRAFSPIIYLKIEQTTHHQIDRLIRCTFRCSICPTECLTATNLENHFLSRHTDCMVDARVKEEVMVISSTDPKTPAPSYQIDWNRYNLYKLFTCPDKSHEFTGSRSDAIQHHLYDHGTSSPFQFRITYEITEMRHQEWSQENEKPHRMYVFKCKSCSKYFESIEDASAHCTLSNDANSSNTVQKHQCKLGFEAMKLVACRACKIVSTFEGIQLHQCDSSRFPVNALDGSRCAFCPLKIDDMQYHHYADEHATGYTLSPKLLKHLNLGANGIRSRFSPGCCSERWFQYEDLDKLVDNHYNCSTNFICTDCNACLSKLTSIVSHYRQDHNRSTDEIIARIQSIERIFNTTPFQLRVMLPTGLILSAKTIANTDFCISELRPRLIEIFQNNVWIPESEEIKSIVDGSNNSAHNMESSACRPRALSYFGYEDHE